jgi:hypothetical protein
VLIGILGSSYTYSNLFVSQNETQMMGEDGSIAQGYPEGFTDIQAKNIEPMLMLKLPRRFKY